MLNQDFCYHIHTPRCGHADKEMPEDVIAKLFCDAGFKSIAFTDHCPYKTFLNPYNPGHAMDYSERFDYLDTVKELAKQYKDRMEILYGFEMEFIPECKDEMDGLRELSQVLLIGQHFVRDRDGNYTSIHRKGFVPSDYELDFYADCLEQSCELGYADILVHPDVFMIHKTEFGRKEREISHRICKVAEKYNVPVEINLCVICKDRFFTKTDISYPRREFWEIAKDYNLRTIYGLDFHGHFNPSEFNSVMELADKVIGKETVSALHLCKRDELKFKHIV